MIEPQELQSELRALCKRHGIDMAIIHVFVENAPLGHDVHSAAHAADSRRQTGINRICEHQINATLTHDSVTQVKPMAVSDLPKDH